MIQVNGGTIFLTEKEIINDLVKIKSFITLVGDQYLGSFIQNQREGKGTLIYKSGE